MDFQHPVHTAKRRFRFVSSLEVVIVHGEVTMMPHTIPFRLFFLKRTPSLISIVTSVLLIRYIDSAVKKFKHTYKP